MAINISAKRRVDISDLGESWGGCYLIVRSMNPAQLKEWQDLIKAEETGEETVDALWGEKLKTVLLDGYIMNTDDDGKEERYKLKPEDISDFVDQLPPHWKQRALMTSAGTYGLKGL